MCCHLIFVARGEKTLRDSQKNVSTLQRKLYYTKEGVPMGGNFPEWQNKPHWWRSLGPTDHFTNSGQCWMSWYSGSRWQITVTDNRWKVGHQLWICIFHHPQGPQLLQYLCKVGAAYRLAHMGTCGNVCNFCSNTVKERLSALHRCWFANDDEVKDMMHVWLHAQPETFFAFGIRKLVDWSNKYMEKPSSKNDSIFALVYLL